MNLKNLGGKTFVNPDGKEVHIVTVTGQLVWYNVTGAMSSPGGAFRSTKMRMRKYLIRGRYRGKDGQ